MVLLLVINNLTLTTLKGRKLIADFSCSLNPGDKIALIGEEGNGKSTLLKVIAGEDVSDYVTVQGNIISEGSLVGYMKQRIEEAWFNSTVWDYLVRESPEAAFPLEAYNEYSQIVDLLKSVNFDTDLFENNQILKTLSGGEKVKLSLARVLRNEPDVLLMDEPTNDLDLKTLIWLEEFIRNTDKTVLFVSHDETLLENCANGIIHLEQLKKKQEPYVSFEKINYRSYLEKRGHFIDKTNMMAAKERQQLNKQLEKYRQIYQKVEYRQRTISRQDPHGGQLLKKKMHAVKAVGRKLKEKEENLTKKFEPEEAIEIFFDKIEINPNKVILEYEKDILVAGDKQLSHDIFIKILAGEKVCIIGDNGCGKTTMLKEMWQLLKPRQDIKAGYMPQNYSEVMDYSLSAVEYLTDKGTREERSKVQSLLGAMKFTTEEMSHAILNLSEGQKCKILLAKLVLSGNDVILLDEPTRNLSPLSNPEVRKMLKDYGGCIIAVSHDRKFINEVCDKIYELDKNGIRELM